MALCLTIRNETISSLANAVLELCQRVEELGCAMPLELVDRSRQILKKSYEEKIQSQQATIDKLVKALELSIKSAEFFSRHADCKRDSWACKCEFCRDIDSSRNLRTARQCLAEVRGEK